MQLAVQMNCHLSNYLKSYHDARASLSLAPYTSSRGDNILALHKEDLEILQANPLGAHKLSESISKLDRLFKSNCRIRRLKSEDGSFLIRTICPLVVTFHVTRNC